MREEQALLTAEHISKRFPSVVALDDVQLSLNKGEIRALLGENGAGKSTLIKVLTGVEKRDSGTVRLEGKEIFPKTPQEAQLAGISTVYQEVNLCPNLTVAENIYIGREPRKGNCIDWKAVNQKAKELLKRFDLDIDVTKSLDTYSVAVQQMVAIARAVDVSAKVLILDEPTSSLSAVEVEKLFSIMRRLKNQGMGIIFVTHFLDQVYEVTDSITVLRNGQYVGTYQTSEFGRVELVAKMIGKEYAELDQRADNQWREQKKLEVLVKLEHAGTAAISDVNLEIRKGEVLGFSGLLGSGRSETVRLLFGVDRLHQGEVTLKGKKFALKDTLSAIRGGFAFCPENRKTEGIIGDLTIRENIILALQAKRGIFKAIPKAEAIRLADEYIEKLQIKTPSQNQLIRNLSGGNQQKVILARWLATEPDLLMLDEPTRGIDIGTKAEIQKIVMELAEEGMAMVFISSELDEMLRCCNRMVVLKDKKAVADLTGEDISEATVMSMMAGGVTNGQSA